MASRSDWTGASLIWSLEPDWLNVPFAISFPLKYTFVFPLNAN
jgi:hypothetical protein